MVILDPLVGFVLVGASLALRRRRSLAVLAALSAVLWLAGDLVEALVFAHRAPLTQLLLLYPGTRIRARTPRVFVGAIWLTSLVYPWGRRDAVTVVCFVVMMVLTMTVAWPRPDGARRSAILARAGLALIWATLAAAALSRSGGARVDAAFLVAYELAIVAAVAAVVVDDRYRRSRGAIVTNLVVDLGAASPGSLRDVVADAVGDPDMELGLLTPRGCIDERGRAVPLQAPPGRVTTPLWDGDRQVAVLHHDPALLRNRRLLTPVAALAAVAVANARLEQEVNASIAEVVASRRRLLAVDDAERDRLERQLRQRVLSRLEGAAAIVGDVGSADLRRRFNAALDTVSSFARGVYPRAVDEHGLGALGELDLATANVVIDVPTTRFPRHIEAAAYFVCVEALTNVAKHAHATTVHVRLRTIDETLTVEVADDGIGGADFALGTGLIGLRDRLEVLGGSLHVASTSHGTRIRGVLPLRPADAVDREAGAVVAGQEQVSHQADATA
jgi:hypothetical protein